MEEQKETISLDELIETEASAQLSKSIYFFVEFYVINQIIFCFFSASCTRSQSNEGHTPDFLGLEKAEGNS